jgi:hypothetical protein
LIERVAVAVTPVFLPTTLCQGREMSASKVDPTLVWQFENLRDSFFCRVDFQLSG